jgi:DNA polymerase III delta prime subunit
MNSIKCIKEICEKFKLGIYTIEDFQARLRTVLIEDELNVHLSSALNDVDNELETILYCQLPKDHYECGCKVADYIIKNLISK